MSRSRWSDEADGGVVVGDGDATRAAVRRLELTVTRRLGGILQGDHLGLLPGPGSEPGEGRPYVPGDDVRHIDWHLTARSGTTQVRDRVADRELATWVVVDCSASLDFGTADAEKRDVAAAAVAVFGFLAQRGANRVGAVLAGPDGCRVLAARPGRDHLRAVLLALHDRPPAGRGRTDLVGALGRTARLASRRGLVVVVCDLVDPDLVGTDGPPPLEVALRSLALRHDVVVVEVRDPREEELPAVGLLTLVDPETGDQLEVQTDDPRLRRAFADAAREHRGQVAAAVRRAGAQHLLLRTDEDWLAAVVRHVATRRRGRR